MRLTISLAIATVVVIQFDLVDQINYSVEGMLAALDEAKWQLRID